IAITITNRGPEAAQLHVLPTLWFRNTWSWGDAGERPVLTGASQSDSQAVIGATDEKLGARYLYCAGRPTLLFTENDTNAQRLFGAPNASPFVKDAFHR